MEPSRFLSCLPLLPTGESLNYVSIACQLSIPALFRLIMLFHLNCLISSPNKPFSCLILINKLLYGTNNSIQALRRGRERERRSRRNANNCGLYLFIEYHMDFFYCCWWWLNAINRIARHKDDHHPFNTDLLIHSRLRTLKPKRSQVQLLLLQKLHRSS